MSLTLPIERFDGSDPKSDPKSDLKSDPKSALKSDPKKSAVQNRIDMILVIIKENPQITRGEIAEMVGVGRTTIMKDLRVLKERYDVRYEGASKTGRWVIGKE